MALTIPKKITSGKDLVIIPLDEYEALEQLRKIYEFNPTPLQKKTLKLARTNRKKGKIIEIDELKRQLGFTN